MLFIARPSVLCWLLYFLAGFSSVSAHASKPSARDLALKRAADERLGESRAWKKILFYAPNFMGAQRSIVDSEGFFLAADGKTNASAELSATIGAIFAQPVTGANLNQHPLCRYPRRISWIIKEVGVKPSDLPQVVCQDFADWIDGKHFEGISLIFSSSYPNNPSSLFGHTFLRMHRSSAEQRSKILDDSINFSAFPDTDNPVTYTWRGIAGGFPGYFSFTPYYLKVQEYSNADSRDLWEYRLNFSREDLDNVINVVWEMGPHKINYYYFDENCSAIILHFFEAAKPELSLTSWQFWVIPSDTVKTVAEVPGLVTDVVYRPSALTRFLAKYRGLTQPQKEMLERLARVNRVEVAAQELEPLAQDEQALVIDGLLEYIDYFERLAGSNEAETYGTLRVSLLKRRTRLPLLTHREVVVPEEERPDYGHNSSRLGVGAGVMGANEAFAEYHWRPALHDKLSSDRGYAAGLGIDFFDFMLRHRLKARKLDVSEYYPLKILSLPRLEPVVKRPAWTLSLGTKLDYSCEHDGPTYLEDAEPCRLYFVNGGIGVTAPALQQTVLSYSLINLSLGQNNQLEGGAYIEPFLESGVLWSPAGAVKVNASLTNRVTRPRHGPYLVKHTALLRAGFSWRKDHELRASSLIDDDRYYELSAAYNFYF